MTENYNFESEDGSVFKVRMDEHEIPLSVLAERYNRVNLKKGLTKEKITKNAKIQGYNKVIVPNQKNSLFFLLLRDSLQGITSILLMGSIVCFMAFILEVTDNIGSEFDLDYENLFLGIGLLIFIIINGVHSYFEEKSIRDLLSTVLKYIPKDTTVIRNGKIEIINSELLVVGDIVELRIGDKVPADLRVIKANMCKVDTSSYTGISDPKCVEVHCTSSNPLETKNLVFASSYIVEGNCRGIVVRVGNSTLTGRITLKMRAGVKLKETKLSQEINNIVLFFTFIGLGFAAMFWITAMKYNSSWSEATIYFVGVLVAVVPQPLLSALRVCHTVAGNKMIKKNCLAKNLDAIEGLGSISVMCIDKTGTITQNKLGVSHIWIGRQILTVVEDKLDQVHLKSLQLSKTDRFYLEDGLRTLYQCLILTTNAILKETSFEPCIEVSDGEPADLALLYFAAVNYSRPLEFKIRSQRRFEIPFSNTKFYRLLICDLVLSNGSIRHHYCRLVMRGAPEKIFNLCSTIMVNGKKEKICDKTKQEFEETLRQLGEKNIERIVGFCDLFMHVPDNHVIDSQDYPSHGYRFVGIVSMTDPIGVGVSTAISGIKGAGIKPIILTGDYISTTVGVARDIGLFSEKTQIREITKTNVLKSIRKTDTKFSHVVKGEQLKQLSDEDLDIVITHCEELAFVRANPLQKIRIIQSCKRLGLITAMVGDGINDCGALKEADIGIVMGNGSALAAKQISDIILLDNNFISMLDGIEEGRLVFENMGKCFRYLISSNIAHVSPFFMLVLFNVPLPISPFSILILDLLVGLFPAIALAYEKPEWSNVMKSKPRDPKDKLVPRSHIIHSYFRIGVSIFAAGALTYILIFTDNGFPLRKLYGGSKNWYSRGRYITDINNQEWNYGQREHLENSVQSSFFFAVGLSQIAYCICCKNRLNSIFTHGMNNWRLNVTLILSFSFLLVTSFTQFHTVLEHLHIPDFISWNFLFHSIPIVIFIFIVDEVYRYNLRKSGY